MFNKRLSKITMILMAVLLVLVVTPMSVSAAEITKSATKKPTVKPDKKLQENIVKAEKQITVMKKEISAKLVDFSTYAEEEVLPMLDEIQTLIESGAEVDEAVGADIEERALLVEDTVNAIADNLENLNTTLKKIQALKKNNPTGYLKELQKVIGKYNSIKKQMNDLNTQLDEFVAILDEVLQEINPPTDGDEGNGDDIGNDLGDVTDVVQDQPIVK